MTCYFVCIYSPPGRDVELIIEDIGDCSQACTNKNKGIVVEGVFNYNFLSNDPRSTIFSEAVEELGLIIKSPTTEPTYVCHSGSSCVDVILSTVEAEGSLMTECETVLTSDRKHRSLRFSLRQTGMPKRGASIVRHASAPLSRTLDVPRLQALMNQQPIDQSIDILGEFLRKSITESCETRVAKHRSRPWFDAECKLAKLNSLSAAKAHSEGLCDLQHYISARIEYQLIGTQKKKDHRIEKRIRTIQESVKRPWLLLSQRPAQANSVINDAAWTTHFEQLLSGPAPKNCRLRIRLNMTTRTRWQNHFPTKRYCKIDQREHFSSGCLVGLFGDVFGSWLAVHPVAAVAEDVAREVAPIAERCPVGQAAVASIESVVIVRFWVNPGLAVGQSAESEWWELAVRSEGWSLLTRGWLLFAGGAG